MSQAPKTTALCNLGDRVPVARAAQLIGVSDDHVRRLLIAGELDGADVRLPGARKASWTVGVASIRRFLERRKSMPENSCATAATAATVERE